MKQAIISYKANGGGEAILVIDCEKPILSHIKGVVKVIDNKETIFACKTDNFISMVVLPKEYGTFEKPRLEL